VQLVDTGTTTLLWAGRFDADSQSALDLQDRVTANLIGAIVARLERAENERAKRASVREHDAYSYTLAGLERLHHRNMNGIDEALRFFLKATELDRTPPQPMRWHRIAMFNVCRTAG
jgi:hypothetical protein